MSDELSPKVIGNIIKQYRNKEGYTQFQLSELIGIADKQIGKIERGVHYPSLPTFLKLIKILRINIDEFYVNKEYQFGEDKLVVLVRNLTKKQYNLAYKIVKDITNY